MLLTLGVIALVAAIPLTWRESPDATPPPAAVWIVLGISVAALGFQFWPLYKTYYTLSVTGIQVRYGPWTREYPWSGFTAAYWRRGMFTTRIGWPSITPCVRLTDGVQLRRRTGRFALYLTPNDSRAFLRKIGDLAPELTAETIL
jgi:hypothetical protein